jgi:hypothetical protein
MKNDESQMANFPFSNCQLSFFISNPGTRHRIFPAGILSTVLGVKETVGPGSRLIWFVRPLPLRPTTSFKHLFGGEKNQ